MTPLRLGNDVECLVVDVGNSVCKIGPVIGGTVRTPIYIAPDPQLPEDFLEACGLLQPPRKWFLSGSNPPVISAIAFWLGSRGHEVYVIDERVRLPIEIDVQYPERVGRDRLLNAMAVTEKPAIVISAGTAVTVDAVSGSGTFLGGAILPGMGLMAFALHHGTAKLPKIEVPMPRPALPAKNTEDAIAAGIFHAAVGGIVGCHGELLAKLGRKTTTYVAGGEGWTLRPLLPFPTIETPWLTLQGIFNAARALWP
jgi:type III pantothenate kinase